MCHLHFFFLFRISCLQVRASRCTFTLAINPSNAFLENGACPKQIIWIHMDKRIESQYSLSFTASSNITITSKEIEEYMEYIGNFITVSEFIRLPHKVWCRKWPFLRCKILTFGVSAKDFECWRNSALPIRTWPCHVEKLLGFISAKYKYGCRWSKRVWIPRRIDAQS